MLALGEGLFGSKARFLEGEAHKQQRRTPKRSRRLRRKVLWEDYARTHAKFRMLGRSSSTCNVEMHSASGCSRKCDDGTGVH